MCGIGGAIVLRSGRPIDEADLAALMEPLQHRGPDGSGVYIAPSGRAGLCHTRLSIIDLAGGAQPMCNEDGDVWISFNGEIFNYVELRAELLEAGHRFATRSDTEVIVHAYEQWGDDFVGHLNGQFAIAMLDTRGGRTRLLLVRDRPGILPLFYTVDSGRLLFASEMKSLLASRSAPPRLSPAALDQIFTFWAPVAPTTLFEGIRELPPGHMLEISDGAITERTYWNWSFPEDGDYLDGSPDELAEQLGALLLDATRIRLRSNVPVGAYLSGGLDSSVLVTLIKRCDEARLSTFSLGFESAQFDETRYQQMLIDKLGVASARVTCTSADIAAAFPETIRHTETAILRTAPAPMRLLSALARSSGYKVVLTGEGADEVLGGYDLFKEAKIRQFWARNPASSFRPQLLKRLYPYLAASKLQTQGTLANFFGIGLDEPSNPFFSHLPRWFTAAQCKAFFSPELKSAITRSAVDDLLPWLPQDFSRWHAFNRAQYLEAKILMGGYLLCSQGDRMLMANSVEGRFPFLDHRVIEFANRLHPRLKMRGLDEKHILKRAMARYLPAEISERPKQPYRAPDIAAFMTGGHPPDYVEQLLAPKKVADYGYFDAAKVDLLVKKARRGAAMSQKDNMAFVGILSTQLCHYHFIEQHASRAAAKPAHAPAQRKSIEERPI